MKVQAIIARIINGPKCVIDTQLERCYYVECIIHTDFILSHYVFFFSTELEASQLKVGDCVLIDTGVDYRS